MQLFFNKDVQLKLGHFRADLLQIEKYRTFIEAGSKKDTNKTSDSSNLSTDLLNYGEKIQDQIAELQSKIKDKIIKLCYTINDEMLDDMTITEYNNCLTEINNQRPDIFAVFLITVK